MIVEGLGQGLQGSGHLQQTIEAGEFGFAQQPLAHAQGLRRVDDDIAWPEELLSIKGVVFTPTFVVTQNNREVGRITGYPGEDYFWGYLVNILKETGFQPD